MTPGYRSHYEILNIRRDASPDEIGHAFRVLSKLHHPDKSDRDGSAEKFCLILNAYRVLTDDVARAEYDRFLKASIYIRTLKNLNSHAQISSGNEELIKSIPGIINMTLWEVEELISRNELSMNKYLLEILTFLDKWILTPGGYRDYFMESRKLEDIDPRIYTELLINPVKPGIRLPYTGVKDYFYALRKRANAFISDCIVREDTGYIPDETIVRDIMEFHNMAVHYLSFLLENRPQSEIPDFPFSSDRYIF